MQTFKPIWSAIKWGLFLIVLAFVAWHGWNLWNQFDAEPARMHWGWIALATAASIVAWAPSVWYWRWIMIGLGAAAPWARVVRAYYCGNLGKYLPGKAAVIVIRAALLKSSGVPATTAGLAVTQETLTCMWAGGISALILSATLAQHLPGWAAGHADPPLVRLALLACAAGGGAAVLVTLLHSHRFLHGVFAGASESTVNNIVHPGVLKSLRMTLTGGTVFLGWWWFHGLTLGLTIRGVIGDRADWSDWPFWTGTAAVAMVGGFVAVFAPGGLGVREGLAIELLEHQLGPREAVLVTVLWRGTSLVGEILAAGALYYGVAGGEMVAESNESKRSMA